MHVFHDYARVRGKKRNKKDDGRRAYNPECKCEIAASRFFKAERESASTLIGARRARGINIISRPERKEDRGLNGCFRGWIMRALALCNRKFDDKPSFFWCKNYWLIDNEEMSTNLWFTMLENGPCDSCNRVIQMRKVNMCTNSLLPKLIRRVSHRRVMDLDESLW